jgi:hypothetical protein
VRDFPSQAVGEGHAAVGDAQEDQFGVKAMPGGNGSRHPVYGGMDFGGTDGLGFGHGSPF